jgi:hypothetical protein
MRRRKGKSKTTEEQIIETKEEIIKNKYKNTEE